MSKLLEVENLNTYYGSIHAVKGITFHVEAASDPERVIGEIRRCGHRDRQQRSRKIHNTEFNCRSGRGIFEQPDRI